MQLQFVLNGSITSSRFSKKILQKKCLVVVDASATIRRKIYLARAHLHHRYDAIDAMICLCIRSYAQLFPSLNVLEMPEERLKSAFGNPGIYHFKDRRWQGLIDSSLSMECELINWVVHLFHKSIIVVFPLLKDNKRKKTTSGSHSKCLTYGLLWQPFVSNGALWQRLL